MTLRSVDTVPQYVAEHVLRAAQTGVSQSGIVCPECGGGSSREVSVTIWMRDARVAVMKCWRHKCGVSWDIAAGGGTFTAAIEGQPFLRQEFTRTLPLSQAVSDICWERWRLSAGTLARYGVAECEGTRRLAIPIYGPAGQWRGQCLRYYGTAKVGSKAINQMAHQETVLGWYRTQDTQPTIVVEDFLSAMRLAQIGRSACSLGGVSIGQDKVDELMQYLRGNFILALDADATARAIKLARQKGFRVMRLDRDFKDCSNEEIIDAIG